MYQPYIRGKQFELIGIKELIPDVLIKNKDKISPIIEPVKGSSTLKTTIKSLANDGINFTLIINPQVGTFTDTNRILTILKENVGNYTNFQIGIIFHENIDHKNIIDLLGNNNLTGISLSIIHNTMFDNIHEILASYEREIKYNVVNLSLTSKRYFRIFEKKTLVELDDYFNAQTKNSDYLKIGESNFSEEHLYYKDEGFIAEALEKLIKWCDETQYDSIAIPIFREYYVKGHFPGLGTLKKLSLMNHIDLVSKLI